MEVRDFEIVEDGTWEEVVSFCRQLSTAFSTQLPEVCNEFEDWRPKTNEGTQEVSQRTNDRESLQETQIEHDSAGTAEEMTNAGKKVRDTGNDMIHGHPKKGLQDMGEAGTATARGIIPVIIKVLRGLEHRIYTYVVGRTNPDYFETEAVTVSIEHETLHGDKYRVRANFQDSDTLQEIVGRLMGGDK